MKIDHHAQREPGNEAAIIHWGGALIGICMMIFIPTPEANILNDIYCGRFESKLAWPYADSESCSKTVAEQPRPQGFSLKKWVGKSPREEVDSGTAKYGLTRHSALLEVIY